MFMASTMQSILNQTTELAEKLKIDKDHREAVVFQTNKDPNYVARFRVSIGEIHWGGLFVLTFEQDKLQSICEERRTSDGSLKSERVEVPE